MRRLYIGVLILFVVGNVMAYDRRDIRDGTGRLLGWTYTEPSGKEKAYHIREGLKGWYSPQSDKTYKIEGGIYSFGNRVDSLIHD